MKTLTKLTAVVVIALLIITTAKAQDYFANKHQISLSNINSLLINNDPGQDDHLASLGLGYKFNKEKFGLRFSTHINYDDANYTDTDDDGDSYKEINKNSMILFNLGFELHSNFERIQLFYGFDCFINTMKLTDNEELYYNDGDWDKDEYDATRTGYGISPLIGVNFFITPHLSLSTETKFHIEMYETTSVRRVSYFYSYYLQEYTSNGSESGTDTRFGPIGQISINIHF